MREFSAKIVDVVDGKFLVFDETYFYPVSGGQPSDTGRVKRKHDNKEFLVVNVKKGERGFVHEVDGEGLAPSDEVVATIDWPRRHKLMRSHTAAHIVSSIINKETGALITGNQLELDKVRIDFSLDEYDQAALVKYLEQANETISRALPVTFTTIPREHALQRPTLSKLAVGLPPSITEIRVVTIEGLDEQACGGTHVKNTAEIGPLEFVKAENKGAKNRRLYFRLKE